MTDVFERILFNTLFGGILSFFAGVLIVFCVIRLFRVGPSGWKLYLLSLPFAKILFDVLRGVPAHAYVREGWIPFSDFAERELSAWLGLSFWGPHGGIGFKVTDQAGTVYTISGVDVIASWLAHHVHPQTPAVLLTLVISIALFLVSRRLFAWVLFEMERRLDRKTAQLVGTKRHGHRLVEIYLSRTFVGSPFTGGVLRPYVCFPAATWRAMTQGERQAALQHELAHVSTYDVLQSFAIRLLGDVFWFVPGYALLRRKIEALREELADRRAVAAGTRPADLASALVRMKEVKGEIPASASYSALVKKPGELVHRVRALLDDDKPAGGGLKSFGTMILVSAMTTVFVSLATLVGNHHWGASSDIGRDAVETLLQNLEVTPFY